MSTRCHSAHDGRARQRLRHLPLLAVLAGVLTMVMTTGAQAQSWRGRYTVSNSSFRQTPKSLGNSHYGHDHGASCTLQACSPSCRYAKIDFRRGFFAGQRAGARTGYADGANGRSFHNHPHAKQLGLPFHFRQGFKAGFRKAYPASYRQGRNVWQHRYDCRRGWW